MWRVCCKEGQNSMQAAKTSMTTAHLYRHVCFGILAAQECTLVRQPHCHRDDHRRCLKQRVWQCMAVWYKQHIAPCTCCSAVAQGAAATEQVAALLETNLSKAFSGGSDVHLVEINAQKRKVGEVGAKCSKDIFGGGGGEVLEGSQEGGPLSGERCGERGQCRVGCWEGGKCYSVGGFGCECVQERVDSKGISRVWHDGQSSC